MPALARGGGTANFGPFGGEGSRGGGVTSLGGSTFALRAGGGAGGALRCEGVLLKGGVVL